MFLRSSMLIFVGVLLGWALMGAALYLASKAASCEREWVGINTISYHFNRDHNPPYNENNLGLLIECRRDDKWGYQLGYYRNSFERNTWYGLVTYQPWEVYGIRIGGMAGLGTGYREKEKEGKDIPRGGLSPLVAGLVSIEGRRLGANLIVGSSVVGLQIKYAFN